MRRDLEGPGVPGWTRVAWSWYWLGPGNTNVAPAGYYPGIPPSRYHPCTTPGIPLPALYPVHGMLLGVTGSPYTHI